MSYHVKDSYLEAKLMKQRRQSTVVSVITALLVCILLAVGLTGILLVPDYQSVDPVINYPSSIPQQTTVNEVEETAQRLDPSPPTAPISQPTLLKALMSGPVALPSIEPSLDLPAPVLGLGVENDDFGGDWGSLAGESSESASVQLFQQEIEARRIAYVIDYSRSLGSQKQALMKAELAKSIRGLPSGIEYSLIFFAGPAWLPGAEVTELSKTKWEVLQNGKSYIWSKEGEIYTSKPAQPRVEWIDSTRGNIRDSVKLVENSGLEFGTSWYTPLEMALKMKPQPDVVFFMTDGLAAGTERVIEDLGEFARKRKIVINTIAINEPRAREAMTELAEMTKGEFSLVDEQGKRISGSE